MLIVIQRNGLEETQGTQKLIVLGFRGQKNIVIGSQAPCNTKTCPSLGQQCYSKCQNPSFKYRNYKSRNIVTWRNKRERRKWNFQLWQGSHHGFKNGRNIPKNTHQLPIPHYYYMSLILEQFQNPLPYFNLLHIKHNLNHFYIIILITTTTTKPWMQNILKSQAIDNQQTIKTQKEKCCCHSFSNN